MNTNVKNKSKGITLIALVITIIVLLILAGVTIATLTGENGILTKATTAKEQTVIGQEKEAISLAYTACKAEDMEDVVTNTELQTELEKGQNNVQVTMSGDDLIVWFKDTGHRYTVKQDGKIEQIGDMTPEEADKIVDVMAEKVMVTAEGKVIYLDTTLVEDEFTELTIENPITITEDGIRKRAENCFVDNKGKVYTWGENFYGQLGDGSEDDYRERPICISDISGSVLNEKNIINIFSDGDTVMAIDDKGKVYTWGDNDDGLLGDGSEDEYKNMPICISDISGSALNGKNMVEISARNCAIAIDDEGKVYTWGSNIGGQLGDGSKDEYRNMPRCISDISGSALNGKNIVEIVSESCMIAIDNEGKVYTWGANLNGELGDGTDENRNMPRCISDISGSALSGKNIINIVYEMDTVIALDNEGKVYAWGRNMEGQLGDGTTEGRNEPICISDISGNELNGKNMTNIFFDGYTAMGIDNEGKVYSWGENSYGKLGAGSEDEYRNMPICISNIEGSALKNKNIVNLYFNNDTIMARDNEGSIYAWGENYDGQLGDGTTENRNEPVCITDNENSKLNKKVINKVVYYDLLSGKKYDAYITSDGKVVYYMYQGAI